MSAVQSAPSFQVSAPSGGHGLTLSDTAARRLAALGEAEGKALMLRVAVDGGGCSGFQYRFDLVETAEVDDIRIETDGRTALVPHTPRLVSDDLSALREAALQGLGIVQLPILLVKADINAGALVDVLPYWRPRADTVCAIFPSRRGLLPSIRVLLDFLSDDCEPYRNQPRARQPVRREAAE